MQPKVCMLIFDGLADWEPAHALCEINKSGKFEVVTIGFSSQPVVTMAGLTLTPQTTISEIDWKNVALFILPGGDMWETEPNPHLVSLLPNLYEKGIPIAAICGATLQIARAGLTRGRRHTSNGLAYLQTMVPDYNDEASYVDELAVSEGNLITASGLGSIEFAREIIRLLRIYSEEDTALWFEMFKRGVIPAAYQS